MQLHISDATVSLASNSEGHREKGSINTGRGGKEGSDITLEKKSRITQQMHDSAFTSIVLVLVALSACPLLLFCLNSCTPCAGAEPDAIRGQC